MMSIMRATIVMALVSAATAQSGSGSGDTTASVYEYHDSSIFAIVTTVVVVGFLALFIQSLRSAMCAPSAEAEASEEGVSAV